MEEDADGGAVIERDARPLLPPRARGVLHQPFGRFGAVRGRRDDPDGFLVGDDIPHPISGKHDELVFGGDVPLRDLWDEDEPKVLF